MNARFHRALRALEDQVRALEDQVDEAWAWVAVAAVALLAVSLAWFVFAFVSREAQEAFAVSIELLARADVAGGRP